MAEPLSILDFIAIGLRCRLLSGGHHKGGIFRPVEGARSCPAAVRTCDLRTHAKCDEGLF